MNRVFFRTVASVAALSILAVGCDGLPRSSQEASSAPHGAGLTAQSAQFPRGVVQVTTGVHVAVGYGLANSVMIEGDGGVVIVDTMESVETATPVHEAFRAISEAPVAAIVYTHNHADHIFGAGVFAGEHAETVPVFAHASFARELDRIVTTTRPVTWRRAMRQFGTLLPEADRLHCGIGPRLVSDAKTHLAALAPTNTFDGDSLEVVVAGVRMLLLHMPGETPDQIAVWLPEKRVLVSGDNYYHSFPNLYAIRGTPSRDVLEWMRSLDRMRELEPEFLVPGHTLPVSGKDEIRTRLTDYRDAIQYVHDQTVRAMNDGKTPDQIVETLRLPDALASRPYLVEHYGRVDWSVRGVFDHYVGWFGGDPADLSPLSRRDRATRVAMLAGGSEKLRDAARGALEKNDARWALELAGHLEALGEFTDVAARVRASAMRMLASSETSANGRNYYLTAALEAEERIVIEPPDPSTLPDAMLRSIPVGNFLRAMTVRLDPVKAAGKNVTVGLRFTDAGEDWGMRVRNSIVELSRGLPDRADMTVTTDSTVWKEILTRKRNATAAFARGDVRVDRNRLELVRFLFLFR